MNNEMTYESALKRLEEIVLLLEKNESSLDESIGLFEEGTALAAFCNQKLTNARQKVTELNKDENNG